MAKPYNQLIHKRQFIEELMDLWDRYPEYRFGQLLANLSRTEGGFEDTWEWKLETWLRKIREYP